jgi:hypothetical protein
MTKGTNTRSLAPHSRRHSHPSTPHTCRDHLLCLHLPAKASSAHTRWHQCPPPIPCHHRHSHHMPLHSPHRRKQHRRSKIPTPIFTDSNRPPQAFNVNLPCPRPTTITLQARLSKPQLPLNMPHTPQPTHQARRPLSHPANLKPQDMRPSNLLTRTHHNSSNTHMVLIIHRAPNMVSMVRCIDLKRVASPRKPVVDRPLPPASLSREQRNWRREWGGS